MGHFRFDAAVNGKQANALGFKARGEGLARGARRLALMMKKSTEQFSSAAS